MARINLKALFGRARDAVPAPVVRVAADQEAAAVELEEAQRAVDAAEASYGAALLDIAADLPVLDEARRSAARRLDRARALSRAFEDQHTAAQAAERKAELDRRVAEADATQAQFRDLVVNDLPLVSTSLRNILRAWAVAEAARQDANAALAAANAGPPRPSVEAFRATTGRPARTLRTERVEMWTDERGEPAGFQDQIVKQHDKTGSLRLPNALYSRIFRHRRTFEISEVLEAERPVIPEMLARAISIPNVMAGDNPIWTPLGGAPGIEFAEPTPRRVLAALDRLERQVERSVDTRQPRTVVKPIGKARDVTETRPIPTVDIQQSM